MKLILVILPLFGYGFTTLRAEKASRGDIDLLRYVPSSEARALKPNAYSDILDTATAGHGCTCQQNVCSCCVRMRVPYIIDTAACVNISYVPQDLGLRVELILGQRILYIKEVSVRNPPPICIGVPYIKRFASICLDFYGISWKDRIGGCLKLQFNVLYFIRQNFDLGCFHFNTLDAESKRAVSRILFELKVHQMMRKAAKHKYMKPKAIIL